MGKAIVTAFILIVLLGSFGYFYVREYVPLKNDLQEYREENETLVEVVNELRKKDKGDVNLKDSVERSYVAADIKDMIEGIEVEQIKEEISITLPGKKLFPPGSVELSEEGKEMLVKLANIIKGMEDRKVMIEGHTDDTKIAGSLKEEFPTNWDLSAKRAVNVVKFLISEVGMEPERLCAVAYGEHQPIATNATRLGRAKNRRIVIDVIPK